VLDEKGIRGDAHAGNWHRQISLLGIESIQRFGEKLGRELRPGDFGENITTEGLELYTLSPLSILENERISIQVTQIGKKCHGSGCAIFRETGDCVMPREGIFGRVLKGGKLKAGDQLKYTPKKIRALIITLSDRASRGEYKDVSGPLLEKKLNEFITSNGWEPSASLAVIPDDVESLRSLITREGKTCDLIFTTGSTGIGPRDIAPEAIRPLLDKEIPGIMEMIRVKYGMEKHNALLSRSIAGVMGHSLVYALPGSPKAIEEYTGEIFKTLRHSLLMLHSIDSH
jgi:molybdenum cofactor synthesis domain-containing protein